MEQQFEIDNPSFKKFIHERELKILDIAQKNTEDIVKREMSLMDFELLMSVNLKEESPDKLTRECRKLREDTWDNFLKKSNGDYNKSMELIDDF